MERIRTKTIHIKTVHIMTVFLMILLFSVFCPAGVYADSDDFSVDNVTVMQDSVNWGQSVRVKLDYTCVPSEPDYISIAFFNHDVEINTVDDGYGGETPLGSNGINVRVDLLNREINDGGKLLKQSYNKTSGKGSILMDLDIQQEMINGFYSLSMIQTMHQYKEDGMFKDDFYDDPEWETIGFNVHTYYGFESFVKDYTQADLDEALSQLQNGDVAAIICREDISTGKRDPDTGRIMTYRDFGLYQAEKRFFDAIKGKDVTLLLCAPSQAGCCAEVNGMDIVNETRDVIIDNNPAYITGLDNGDVQLVLQFPDNGELPGTIKFRVGTKKSLAQYLGGNTGQSIDRELLAMKVYHVVSGELVKEDTKLTIDSNDKVWIALDHNSNFVASNSNPKNLKSFKASARKVTFIYNGKVQKPVIDVEPMEGTSYSTKYGSRNSKKVGKYTATVKGTKGGFGAYKVTYTIRPKGTSIKKLKRSGKTMSVKWARRTKQTDGYQIQYSTKKNFKSGKKTVTIKSAKKTTAKISKLKPGKKYYVRIRTYKTVSGKRIYSSWSKKSKV